MRRVVLAALMSGAPFWAAPVFAQEAAAVAPQAVGPAILSLDYEQMFNGSAFGQALTLRHESETQALTAENRKIEAALEVEEKDLTARRATLPREEFTPLADAFNAKVEGIRAAQAAKLRELSRRFDEERARFLDAVRPILADIMVQRGAFAIIDKRAIFVGFDNIDITAEAIDHLDAAMTAGTLQPPKP